MGATGPRALRRAASTALAVGLTSALAACGQGGAGSGGGGEEQQPFAGDRIDFVVPYEPGGGYDTYARALAPYLEECLDATIVVQNEPGAGGLVATNKTVAAGPNENRFQITNTVGLVSAQIAGEEGANFEVQDLKWLGRVAAPANLIVVNNDSDYGSFQDMVDSQEKVRFVAQGPGANDYLAPGILGEAYGFDYEIVTGFAGSPEARQAVVAGDADAHILPVDSQLPAVESGDVTPLVTIDQEPDPLLPDVPTIYDAAPPEGEAKEVIDSLVALGQTGRGLIAPTQMDEAKVDALSEAWTCVAENDDAVADFEKQKRPIQSLDADETADLVAEVLDSPESFTTLVTESY